MVDDADGSTESVVEYTSSKSIDMVPEVLYRYMISIQRTNKGTYNKKVTTLSSQDLNRPFVGRGATVTHAAELYYSNDKDGGVDRNNYSIPVAACIPGMGKTHLLNKLEEILTVADVKDIHMAIIVQYYNGQSVQWLDDRLSAECALCWRILYVVFVEKQGWTFSEFCSMQLLPWNCAALNLPVTLETVRLALVEDCAAEFGSEDTMVIALGIDEFQKIASHDTKQKARLTDLCLSLYASRSSNHVRVYPMFAGTDWALIQECGRSSGLPIKRLPMPLLAAKEVDEMVQPLLEDLPFSASLVSKHLFILGSLPRAALKYSKMLTRHRTGGGEPSAVQMESAYHEVYHSCATVWQGDLSLQAKLLALCFTMTNVKNSGDVTYVKVGQRLSANVHKLADSGYCLINTLGEAEYVSVFYLLVRLFAQGTPESFATEAEKCLLHSVQWLVQNVDECLYAKSRWEQSVDFGCAYMACRMNSFLVLGRDTLTVEELWTGAKCNMTANLKVKLRPTEVVRAGIQLSADMPQLIPELGTARTLDWLRGSSERAFIFRNGVNGAGTDTFFLSLPVAEAPDNFVFFAEQTKDAASATLSPAKVYSLCEAQSNVCPASHTAVLCLRNSFPRVSKDFVAPNNSIVILRGQLKSFYGMFCDHPAATARVNVNECNRAQLQAMQMKKRGGSTMDAVKLVWERVRKAAFGSETEFKDFLDTNGIDIAEGELVDCMWPE